MLHMGLLIHHKNEVVDKLEAFKIHVEQKSRKAIKVLRMDNERKYVDKRIKDFCKLEEIDLYNPPAFSPHKTNIAALRIHTLKSMASCMIQAKSLDPTLEVEAISNTTHILNRSPHIALDGKTSFQAWCGRKLVVSHFRVFSCLAWENLSSKGCKARAPRPCTFIRYEESVKEYRLMDPETHEIFIERDVQFEEISPNLSSIPLCTSYIVGIDSDTNNCDSIDLDMWDPID